MKIIPILILFIVPLLIFGQEMPANANLGKVNTYPFITSSLLEISEQSARNVEQGLRLAKSKSMPVQEGRVYVEVVKGAVTDLDLTIDEKALEKKLNLQFTSVYKNRASAWIGADRLLEVGKRLPKGYSLHPVNSISEDNQGPALTNSITYQSASTGGQGVRIAVIDGGFDGLTEARNAGVAPTAANTTAFNYTGSSFQSGGSHGTSCLETAFDHAPNAEYYLMKVSSLSDLGAAVQACINNGVDVITHSQSKYNTGWGDNSGAACAAAKDASDAGILFFTSAGNRNGTHWQGNFSDGDNDDWHNWSGGDEQNNFSVSEDGEVRARLQWNGSSLINHYDLYLYESGTNNILASSTNIAQFESFNYTSDADRNVYLAVKARTPNPPAFELFNHDKGCTDFQYASNAGSSTSPSNSTAANVISVGAVHRNNYNEPSGTMDIIASYSSRGPTNSGNQSPDISAPTSTSVMGGTFSGTSCATPNAAGMAAAFWSGHPQLNARGVRHILFRKARLYKDWGDNGADPIYGRGGVFLYDYHVNNRYIVRSALNYNSSSTLPYYDVARVDNHGNVPQNRRMIHLQGSDLVGNSGTLLNKPMLYKSVNGTVIRSGVLNSPAVIVADAPVSADTIANTFNYIDLEVVKDDASLGLYPNPVVQTASIEYLLENESDVNLSIYDLNGTLVETLAERLTQSSGTHLFEFKAAHLPPGIYFCRLSTEKETKTVKFVVGR